MWRPSMDAAPGEADSTSGTADLHVLCRHIDDRIVKGGGAATSDLFTQLFESFSAELRRILEASPPDTSSGDMNSAPSLAAVDSGNQQARPRLKRAEENSLAAFCDVICRVPVLVFEQSAIRAAVDGQLVEGLMKMVCNTSLSFSRRLIDAAGVAVVALLVAHPSLVPHCCEPFLWPVSVSTCEGITSNATAQPLLRVLLNWHTVMQRVDLESPALANEAKAHWAQLGALDTLRSIVVSCRARCASDETLATLRPVLHAIGVVAMSVIGALLRSNVPIKEALLDDAVLMENWAHLASTVERMQCTVTDMVPHPVTLKPEEHVVSCETTAVWCSEMAGFALELCTSNSFTLQRQGAFQVGDDDDLAVPAPSPATPASAKRRWEHLPADWDAQLASAQMSPWRIASAVSSCTLTAPSARILLTGLVSLDLSEPSAEFVFKVSAASLLCLCRANPSNVAVLCRVGAIDSFISFMAPNSELLIPREGSIIARPTGPAAVVEQATHSVWPIASAVLTTLLSHEMGAAEISTLMRAIDGMVDAMPTRDDCDVVETALAVLASTTYTRGFLWFDGSTSTAIASLERFGGRWYGYSFSVWLCASCVWPEGGLIYAIRDPSAGSALALCIVANGRTKCLAVRAASSRDQYTMSLIPEAVIGDGWHHVAVVHNISGFFVYVNGRKAGSPSVTYPKEPSKPHKLEFAVGGGNRALQVPPFFGMMSSAQLVDHNLDDGLIEKIAASPIGTTTLDADPSLGEKDLVRVGGVTPDNSVVDISGPTVRDSRVTAVTNHVFANVDAALKELQPHVWATQLVAGLGTSPNRSSVIILSVELIAGWLQQRQGAVDAWDECRGISKIGAELMCWDSPQPEVLSSFFALIVAGPNTKNFRDHPTTGDALRLLFDVMPRTTPEARAATLRELSEYLNAPCNAAYVNKHLKTATLLHFVDFVDHACLHEFANVAEKLVRDPPELEAMLHFIVSPATSPPATIPEVPRAGSDPARASGVRFVMPSRLQKTLVKVELLRMIYDVAKARQSMLDALNSVGAVQQMLCLLQGDSHDSEMLRVVAIRIIALILHTSRKQRDAFVRGNMFDVMGSAILAHSAKAPVGIATFNALFKFALDFYRPSANENEAVLTRLRDGGAAARHVDPAAKMHGHTPSMAQVRPLITRAHSITSVGSSDRSDIDARLSMDDAGDGSSRDTLVHPQVVHTVMRLLGPIVQAYMAETGTPALSLSLTDAEAEVGADMPGSATGSGAETPSVADSAMLISRVLRYLNRMVELSHNASVLLPHPWLEWFGSGLGPLLPPCDGTLSVGAALSLEPTVRKLVRTIVVADMTRSTKASCLRRIRDMPDCPRLQALVLHEATACFARENSLDTLDKNDASNVLKNLETALTGVEDVVRPFPLALGLHIVKAVESIALHNTSWVRQKMKTGKVFELRDRLAVALLTSVKDLQQLTAEAREELRHSTHQDATASLYILRQLVDAVREKRSERCDALTTMLRGYYAADEEQRKAIARHVGDNEIVDRLVNVVVVVDGTQVHEPLLAWVGKHEVAWEAAVQRILRAARSLDNDIASRADKRDKDFAARLKQRRLDTEKREQTLQRQWGDSERQFAEQVYKASTTHAAASSTYVAALDARLQRYATAAIEAPPSLGRRSSTAASLTESQVSAPAQ